MRRLRTVFAVIDPTTDDQRALRRACRIAKATDAVVHAYLCVYNDTKTENPEALKRVEMLRHRLWLDGLVASAEKFGAKCHPTLEWHRDWREAIINEARAIDADLIIKSSFRHTGADRILKTSDLRLLRAAHCPVLLIKRDALSESGNVLVALNLAAKDEAHIRLNERIIENAQLLIAHRSDLRLHAVNAYESSEDYVHPPDLAAKFDIDRTEAHVVQGSPESVIAKLAQELDTELVMIGTVARQGVRGLILGNTAERLLDTLNADVLTVIDSD